MIESEQLTVSTLPNQDIKGQTCVRLSNGEVITLNRVEAVIEENLKLKELLKECSNAMNNEEYWLECELIKQIEELLGDK